MLQRSEWTLWPDENRLSHPVKEAMRFTHLETDILEGIIRAHGHVARRDYLCQFVWGIERSNSPDPRELDVIVCRLRNKLAIAPTDFEIETIRGVGYATSKHVEVMRQKPGQDSCPTCGRTYEEKVI